MAARGWGVSAWGMWMVEVTARGVPSSTEVKRNGVNRTPLTARMAHAQHHLLVMAPMGNDVTRFRG